MPREASDHTMHMEVVGSMCVPLWDENHLFPALVRARPTSPVANHTTKQPVHPPERERWVVAYSTTQSAGGVKIGHC